MNKKNIGNLYFFFFIILLSSFETLNPTKFIEFSFFQYVNVKWFCYLIIILFFFKNIKKINYEILLSQKFFFFFIVFLFTYSLLNYFNYFSLINKNFDILKTTFKWPDWYSINIYLISKFTILISIFLSSCLLIYFLKSVNIAFFKICIFLYFSLIILLSFIIQFFIYLKLNPDLNTIESLNILSNSINRNIPVAKFVGKKIFYSDGSWFVHNIVHDRFIGVFKEPSSLAFFLSVFFILRLENISKTLIFKIYLFFLNVIAALLLIGCVSLKFIVFYPLIIIIIYLRADKNFRNDFIYIIIPFVIAIILDYSLKTNFTNNLLHKIIYYFFFLISNLFNLNLENFFITNFNIIEEANDKSGFLLDTFNLDNLDKSNKFEIVSYIGSGFVSENISHFYKLFLGRGMFFYYFILGGFFSILIYFQMFINVKDHCELKNNSLKLIYYIEIFTLLILVLFYFFFAKDQLNLEIIVIQVLFVILINNLNTHVKS